MWSSVEFTLLESMKAQTGIRGNLYSFLNLGARWGWMVNATPWFYPPGKDFICEDIIWLVYVDISSSSFDQTLFTATPALCARKVPTFKT